MDVAEITYLNWRRQFGVGIVDNLKPIGHEPETSSFHVAFMWEMWFYGFGFLKNLPISPMLHYTTFPLRLLSLIVSIIYNYAFDIMPNVLRSSGRNALKLCSYAKVAIKRGIIH